MNDQVQASEIRETRRFSSRKFTLALLVILIGTGMAAWGKLNQEYLVDLLKWITGMYLGFNVTEKGAELFMSKDSKGAK